MTGSVRNNSDSEQNQQQLQDLTRLINDWLVRNNSDSEQSQQRHQDLVRLINDQSVRSNSDSEYLAQFVRQYEQDRRHRLRDADEAEKKREQNQRIQVINWISGTEASQLGYHNGFGEIRKQFPDTCNWVLKNEKIRDWMNSDPPTHSMLWMNEKKAQVWMLNGFILSK